MPRVTIFAHEAGAACGKDRYKHADLVQARVLKRIFPDAALGPTTADEVTTRAAVAEATAKKDVIGRVARGLGAGAEADALAEAMAVEATAAPKDRPEAAARVQAAVATVTQKVVDAVGEKVTAAPAGEEGARAQAAHLEDLREVRAVQAAARAKGYTRRGIDGEAAVLARYAASAGVDVTKPDRFMTRAVDASSSWPLWVGGYLDGLSADGKVVVEVKIRQRRIFSKAYLPFRELAQIYVYMFVARCKQGVWLQAFGDALDATTIHWEDAVWASIVKDLVRFRDRVQAAAEDLAKHL